MPVLLNTFLPALVARDVTVGQSYGAPVVLGITLNPAQENNRRLLANVYLYRRIVDPAITEFFAIEEIVCRQRRSGRRFGITLNSTDVIRIIPFYDFDQAIILLQQTGA